MSKHNEKNFLVASFDKLLDGVPTTDGNNIVLSPGTGYAEANALGTFVRNMVNEHRTPNWGSITALLKDESTIGMRPEGDGFSISYNAQVDDSEVVYLKYHPSLSVRIRGTLNPEDLRKVFKVFSADPVTAFDRYKENRWVRREAFENRANAVDERIIAEQEAKKEQLK